MKKIILFIVPLAAILLSFVLIQDKDFVTLAPGEKAPALDVKMMDISGKEITLKNVAGKHGLLVIFNSNTCPFVINWQDRYPALGELSRKSGIGMVLINSNEARRSDGEGFEDMKLHAEKFKYNSYYALDKNHVIADAFGARTTPHVFLINSKMEIVYTGAIDDNNKDASAVKEKWLEKAMLNLVAGKTIDPNTSRNLGCSIKRTS